jgi:hypothetical protein
VGQLRVHPIKCSSPIHTASAKRTERHSRARIVAFATGRK